MSQPSWLPPLNSHQNYVVQVQASETLIPPNTHSTKVRKPAFLIKLTVTVDYYPEEATNNEDGFPGFSLDTTLHIDRNPKTLISSLREDVLNENFVPFQLDSCRWRETCHRFRFNPPPWTSLDDGEEISNRIVKYLLKLNRNPDNAKRKILCVNLEIRKAVRVPGEEFRSWMCWYEEQREVNPEFDDEYEDAISRPRDEIELLEEAMSFLTCKSASIASVNELESVIYNSDEEGGKSDDFGKSCSICLEEFLNGSRVTKLPCLHVFHGECVVRWLKGNHICPLCRHPLPIDDK
ncbi:hypothetical protein BUALT_Bualt13G0074000 [Buddleja alternifolia]|uniref:RING-type domain-containing protein n=1 Tax=Buddleja alternifolia TaxID=168488 RepID=A0AAV6WJM8_9LAMI|nr:hypothetical protein BUALT_Bualt13G0074000 [Buddleja alternifolia]